MHTSQFLTLGFSALAILDGVAAQAALATLTQGGQPNSNSNGNPTNGQAASLTDPDNFINFCQGKIVTNGLQNTQGSCNPIVMGDLPAKAKMISTVITNPQNGQNIPTANTPFNVQLQISNLEAGTFTNPDSTYYTAPQHLNAAGQIIGHVHVTIQDMGADINSKTPPDPTTFAFFKGIDDAGNGQGALQAVVTKGLPAGNYRICTMSAASNHQPVMMPVAQRGAQDDCVRITVGAAGAAAGAAGAASSSAAAGAAAASTSGAAAAKGAGAATTPAAAAAAAGTSGAAGKGAAAAATTSAAAGAGKAGAAAGKSGAAAGTAGAAGAAAGKSGAAAAPTAAAGGAKAKSSGAAAAPAASSAAKPAAAPAAASSAAKPAAEKPAGQPAGRPAGARPPTGGRGRGRGRAFRRSEDNNKRFVAREFIV